MTAAVLYLLLLALVVSLTRPEGRPGYRRRLARFSGRFLTFCCGALIVRYGERPPGGSFLVANHRSWVDALVFIGEAGAVFVVQERIQDWPLIGFLVKSFGNLFINRSSLREIAPVKNAVRAAMDAGDTVMIFPEADTADGLRERLLPFRPALFETVAGNGDGARCAALDFTSCPGWPAASSMVSWADWTPLLWHAARLMMMPFFIVRVRYLPGSIRGKNRKELAVASRNAVADALGLAEPADPAGHSGETEAAEIPV